MPGKRALATVSAIALVLLTFFATPAAASGAPAYNQVQQDLTSWPNTGNQTCIQIRIWLAAHDYQRTLFIEDHYTYQYHQQLQGLITLGQGWYTWKDCLQGTNNWTYVHTQTLDPDNPNWASSTWDIEWDQIVPTLNCGSCPFVWGGRLEQWP